MKHSILIIAIFNFFSLTAAKERSAFFYFSLLGFKSVTLDVEDHVMVNGKQLILSDTLEVRINYPYFDTVQVISDDESTNRFIITRFQKGHFYEFSRDLYKYAFEFFDANEIGIYNRKLALIPENEIARQKKLTGIIDSIRVNKESGSVSFKLINYTDKLSTAGTWAELTEILQAAL